MQILKPPTPGKKSPSILERLGQAILPAPAQPAKTVPTGSKPSSSVVGKAGASVGGAAPRTTGTVPGVKGTTFPSTSKTAGVGSSASPSKTVPAAAVTPSAPASGIDPLYTPNETQKQEANLVAKLPSEFPILAWDTMSTALQQKVMEKSGLSPQDQWKLLNASTSLEVLSLLNEIQNNAKSGLLTSSEASKITDQTLRYSDNRIRLVSGDASYLPPLQKALWNRELDKVFGDLQDKTKGDSKSGKDQTPKIADSPAVKQMLSGNQANANQKFLMDQTQKSLDLLYKKGTPSQQQVDNIIAGMCTKLLNDSNAPRLKSSDEQQAVIPAYTNAIDGLLGRLRTLGESKGKLLAKQGQRSMPYNGQPSLGSPQIWINLCDLFCMSLERGNLNLRERDIWERMVTQYDATAPSLSGSQYMFVYDGQLLRVEDAGNAIYGYYGSALGLTPSDLYQGAGIAAAFKKTFDSDSKTVPNVQNGSMADDTEDLAAIAQGIRWYTEGK